MGGAVVVDIWAQALCQRSPRMNQKIIFRGEDIRKSALDSLENRRTKGTQMKVQPQEEPTRFSRHLIRSLEIVGCLR